MNIRLLAFAFMLFAAPIYAITLDDVRSSGLSVTTLDGKTTSLAALIPEGQVVVIDFWATWCRPCLMEMPTFEALHRDHEKDGLIILGLVTGDKKEAVEKFLATQHKIPYFVALGSLEVYKFFRAGNRIGLPLVFVFGRDGRMIDEYEGLSMRTTGSITAAVTEALTKSAK